MPTNAESILDTSIEYLDTVQDRRPILDPDSSKDRDRYWTENRDFKDRLFGSGFRTFRQREFRKF